MTTMNNHEFIKRDLACLWHPCTQMKDHEAYPPIPIRRANGVWLEDLDGKRYLDAISSWWVNLFGHANPRINAALREQLERLEHVLLAGFSHEPAVELAERLVDLTPEGLVRCFYADNGSSAIEVALKMSYHYWRNQGKESRTRFINLSNSYHGETLGALSVGDVSLYRETYGPLLLEPITVSSPDDYLRPRDETPDDYLKRRCDEMEAALDQHAGTVCAVIVEPLVQCAGSMRMYDPAYLTWLRQACDRHNVHLIADEIAVGFGRTGTMFACEQAGIAPDLLCLSKGLTGGYLPLAVTLCTDRIYQAFYDDYGTLRAFLHSHSYTGNPLGCSAALATLDIFSEDNVIERNRGLSQVMETAVAGLADHPHIADIRQHGMILAMEMVADKSARRPYPWQERRGQRVYRHGLEHGMLLRPLGDVVYFMPPYIIDTEEIRLLAQVAAEGIDIATQD